jgi:hypothetical protein
VASKLWLFWVPALSPASSPLPLVSSTIF